MAEAIENLRIYKQARTVEDEIYELVKTFPADQFYGLGNDLRRSSAAVSHHIMEAHRLFSYRLKIDALTAMRREVEGSIKHLAAASDQGLATTTELIDQYTRRMPEFLKRNAQVRHARCSFFGESARR